MNKNDNILKLMVLALISIIPLISILILSFALMEVIDMDRYEILITYVNMTISFAIIPFIIFKYFYPQVKLKELGLRKFDYMSVGCLLILIILVLVFYFIKNDSYVLLYGLQVLPVAVSEEFWARGIVYYISKDIFKKDIVAIILSSFIFAFITHLDEPIIDNLIYRLPGALLLAYIFYKTKRLELPITIHFLNNFIGGV